MTSAIWSQLKQLRLTPVAGLLFTVVSVIAIPFGDFAPDDDLVDIGLELMLGIIATAVFWIAALPGLWLSNRGLGEGWGRSSALLVAVAFGGVVRGVLIFEVSGPFMFDSGVDFWQRVANSLSTTLLWLLVFALFSNAASAFQLRYQELFGQLTFYRASRVSGSEVQKIFRGLEVGIREISDVPIDESKAKVELERIALSLERDIIEQIKAHSKALWSFSRLAAPKLKMLPLLRMAISKLDYPLAFVIALFGTLSLLNISSTVGFDEAAWRVALALGVLTAIDIIYRRLIRPKIRFHAWANLAYLAFSATVVQFPLGMAGYLVQQSSAPVAFIIVASISAPLIMVLLSVLNLADLARRDLLDELRTFDEKFRNRDLVGSSNINQLAAYLHNSLQSEIQSIILALKNEASAVSVGKSSLERLRLLSSRSLDEEFARFASLPREHLDLVVQGWSGILEISVDWDTAPELSDDPRVSTVVQIIEEVASNSAVHGRATQLTATVKSEGSDFLVEVSNNAPDIAAMADRGQGSRWLAGFTDEKALNQNSEEFRRCFRL